MSERTHLSRRRQAGRTWRAPYLIALCLAAAFALLFVACEDESPTGPGSVSGGDGPGSVTVTKTTSSTTTSTTAPTTTTVPAGEVLHFVALQAPPEAPNDITLLVQLLPAQDAAASLLARVPGVKQQTDEPEEARYSVQGTFQTGSGINGEVNGELGGSPDPLELGGQFEGTLTATVEECTAEREFSGTLSRVFLEWTGGETLQDCPESPLSFDSLSLVHTDAPPLTTTVEPTTTSTTTTTTPLVCNFTLTPTSATIDAAGGSREVVIETAVGCNWTAQSQVDWITIRPPASGNRPAKIVYDVSPTTAERKGTLVIAGVPFVVTQTGP